MLSPFSDDIYSVVPKNASEHLAVLASEYNEDPEELKRRVLNSSKNFHIFYLIDTCLALITQIFLHSLKHLGKFQQFQWGFLWSFKWKL